MYCCVFFPTLLLREQTSQRTTTPSCGSILSFVSFVYSLVVALAMCSARTWPCVWISCWLLLWLFTLTFSTGGVYRICWPSNPCYADITQRSALELESRMAGSYISEEYSAVLCVRCPQSLQSNPLPAFTNSFCQIPPPSLLIEAGP